MWSVSSAAKCHCMVRFEMPPRRARIRQLNTWRGTAIIAADNGAESIVSCEPYDRSAGRAPDDTVLLRVRDTRIQAAHVDFRAPVRSRSPVWILTEGTGFDLWRAASDLGTGIRARAIRTQQRGAASTGFQGRGVIVAPESATGRYAYPLLGFRTVSGLRLNTFVMSEINGGRGTGDRHGLTERTPETRIARARQRLGRVRDPMILWRAYRRMFRSTRGSAGAGF